MDAALDTEKRRQLTQLAVLWRIQREGEQLGILPDTADQRWIEKTLSEMDVADLLDPGDDNEHLALTKKGVETLQRLAATFDRVQQLQIFARVHLFVDLATATDPRGTGTVVDEEGNVHWDVHNPLFGDPDEPTSDDVVDMRLAMAAYLAETHPDGPQEFDPYVLVFLEMLAQGVFASDQFWWNLRSGETFRRIEDVVSTAKPWRSTAADEDTARTVMDNLYRMGLEELHKREGKHCSACNGALALYIEADGDIHTECPIAACGASFAPPEDPDVAGDCPNCEGQILRGQVRCSGCGAHINYALPAGTVRHGSETVTETDTNYVWSHEYAGQGYVPVGYYDPYGYPTALFATGLIVGAILF